MTRFVTYPGPATSGALLIILAGTLFAAVNTLVQYGAMIHGIPPTKLAFWQYFVALLFSTSWLWKHGVAAMKTKVLGWHILRVILAAAGVQMWVAALAHVPIWQAIALIMLSPLFVTLGAVSLLGEHGSFQRWSAVATGFIGGMVILAPWSEAFDLYSLLPVGAAMLWAASSLVTKRMTRIETPEALTVYLLLLLTPVNAVIAWSDGFALDFGVVGLIVLATGLLTVFAQYAIAKAYSLADAAYLQPFDNVKLLLNVGLGIAVFGFYPPGSMWLGAALIVGASTYLLGDEVARGEPA